jgi:hypothetical protein
MDIMDLDTRVLINEIRTYAELPKNYNNGWDVLVECWNDEHILDELGKSRSLPYAKWKLGKVIKTYEGYRQEIINA